MILTKQKQNCNFDTSDSRSPNYDDQGNCNRSSKCGDRKLIGYTLSYLCFRIEGSKRQIWDPQT
jgi:hypothetical protein